jgi:hypothetical protein
MIDPIAHRTLPDGLAALRNERRLADIMRLIERTARWVAPETFKLLPVWFPEYARRASFYKANWSVPQNNTNKQTGVSEHKRESNRYANITRTCALGLSSDDRPNWSCCHVWGIDDPKLQASNAVVQDHRYYSCVANMVLLPTPLKAFTDSMPEVKAMLRICAGNLYGWECEHAGMTNATTGIVAPIDWSAYPESWPRTLRERLRTGVIPIDDGIRNAANVRLARIERDLRDAGEYYPRDKVRTALSYWNDHFDPVPYDPDRFELTPKATQMTATTTGHAG